MSDADKLAQGCGPDDLEPFAMTVIERGVDGCGDDAGVGTHPDYWGRWV